MNSVETVVQSGLCIGCCACMGCKWIKFETGDKGFPVPKVMKDCTECGDCLKECPMWEG